MKKELTCIVCPNSCTLQLELDANNAVTSITGNTCPRGEAYGRQEMTNPVRTVTSSVRVINGELPLVSVRLTHPIPKAKMKAAMDCIKKLTVTAPVAAGSIIQSRMLGYESDLIATKDVLAKE